MLLVVFGEGGVGGRDGAAGGAGVKGGFWEEFGLEENWDLLSKGWNERLFFVLAVLAIFFLWR